MKIAWTFIINTKKLEKAHVFASKLLKTFNSTNNVAIVVYWKDPAKCHLTFNSVYNDFSLENFLTNELTKISKNWALTLDTDITEINGYTSTLNDSKYEFATFAIMPIIHLV